MAEYTNLENKIFSSIAYCDLGDRFEMYQRMGYEKVPLKEILSSADKERIKKQCNVDIDSPEYDSWSLSGVYDKNLKNGLYACVIETEPPGENGKGSAAVAFRGSETGLTEDLVQDWAHADFGLLNSELTTQQKEVDRFLKKESSLLGQYDLSMVGHSLGGNLAEYATIVSDKYGLDDNIVQCTSLDGPGFSASFIKEHRKQIEKMGNRMTHYRWSIIGGLLFDLPIGQDHYVYLKSNEEEGGPVLKHCLEYLFVEDGSFIINPDGYAEWERDIRAVSEMLDGGLFLDKNTHFAVTASIAIKVFGFDKFVFVMAGKTILGAIGNFIADATGYSSFDEFYASRHQRRAQKEASEHPDFEIDYMKYQELAKDYNYLIQALKDTAKAIRTTSDPPSISWDIPDNFWGEKPIEFVMGLVDKLFIAIDKLINPIYDSAKKVEECSKTMEAVIQYLSETGKNFEAAETLARKAMEQWSQEH